MTDVQASIGRVQLRKLPSFLERRQEIFNMYKNSFLDLIESENSQSVFYRAVIKVKNPIKIKDKLLKKGIKTIVPIEDWELLDSGLKYKNAYNLTQTTLSLPIYPSLMNVEIESIVSHLKKIIK